MYDSLHITLKRHHKSIEKKLQEITIDQKSHGKVMFLEKNFFRRVPNTYRCFRWLFYGADWRKTKYDRETCHNTVFGLLEGILFILLQFLRT